MSPSRPMNMSCARNSQDLHHATAREIPEAVSLVDTLAEEDGEFIDIKGSWPETRDFVLKRRRPVLRGPRSWLKPRSLSEKMVQKAQGTR